MAKVFLSYARLDDRPSGNPDVPGFVSFLHDQLNYAFDDLGPPFPKLIRDKRFVEDGDQFLPLIKDAVNGSDLLLVVLSPNWMDRKWCQNELEWFEQRWMHEGEDRLRRRIIVVDKRYLDPSTRPLLLQDQVGYKFYRRDNDDPQGAEKEFWFGGSFTNQAAYNDVLKRLALFLRRRATEVTRPVLTEITSKSVQTELKPRAARTIFIAQPAKDMADYHRRLVSELQGRGYRVVPNPATIVPHDETATTFIDSALASADLSVHLLGELLGYAPEDADFVARLQLSRAAARLKEVDESDASKPQFHRVIWAPKILTDRGAAAGNLKTREPQEVLARFGDEMASDKIVGDAFGEFQQFLIRILEQMPAGPRGREGSGPHFNPESRVYVYHRREDQDYAERLGDAIEAWKAEPIWPVFDGDPKTIDEVHQENLLNCNGYIVCWGAGASEAWFIANSRKLTAELRNLDRLQGQCRGGIAGPPVDPRKEFLRRRRPKDSIDVFLDLTAYEVPPAEALSPLFTPDDPTSGPAGDG